MAEEKMIEELKKEFSFLRREKISALLLFGSRARKEAGPRDVDLCIVAPCMQPKEVLKKVYRKVDVHGKHYDVYCFEELPLYMKWEVIAGNKIIYAKDKGELYEYFYRFIKLREEQKHRQEVSKEDVLKSFQSGSAVHGHA